MDNIGLLERFRDKVDFGLFNNTDPKLKQSIRKCLLISHIPFIKGLPLKQVW